MAVATTVLERQTTQKQSAEISADEMHNAKIRENYARLINPELNIKEVREGATESAKRTVEVQRASILQPQASQPVRQEQYIHQAAQPAQAVYAQPAAAPVRPAQQAQPYLVQSARTDSALFRADSVINRRRAETVAEAPQPVVEDEENEDLVPTRTTIQYKTYGESNIAETKVAAESRTPMIGKREKVIIATFIAIVATLLVLVIVNSAVIAGLNSEIALLGGELGSASQVLEDVTSQIGAITSPENIANYAQLHGLYLV